MHKGLWVRERPSPWQRQFILAGSLSVDAVMSAEQWTGIPGGLGGPQRASNTMVRGLDSGSAQRNEFI